MRIAVFARSCVVILALFVCCTIATPKSSEAQSVECRPGERKATASDIVVQKNLVPVGSCYNPNDPSIGVSAEEAKAYLNSIWCGNKANSCGKYTSTIEGLDSKFAGCIAAFLKQYKAKDPSICITSAYRSTEHQRCTCGSGSSGCAAPGKSNHQKGIAVDLRARNYNDMHAVVRSTPGLRHLTLANDPYHVEADNTGRCGFGTQSQNTGPADQMSPTSGLMQALRNYMNPQQQPQQAQSASQLPAAQNPFDYASTSVSTNININTNTNTSTSTAAIDLISALANPTTTVSSATGTVIGFSGGTAVVLNGTQGTGQSPSSTYALSPTGQQTFRSNDLKNSQPGNYTGNSTWQILENMKRALLQALAYLKPFGSRTNVPVHPDEMYLE